MTKQLGLITLAVLSCMQANASPVALSSAVAQLNSPTCLSVLETSVASVAAISADAQKNILANLDYYQSLVGQARVNLRSNQSNRKIYSLINQSLDARSQDTVAGLPVGAAITDCVRPQLNFSGSREAQLATTTQALQKIESIRKAVK